MRTKLAAVTAVALLGGGIVTTGTAAVAAAAPQVVKVRATEGAGGTYKFDGMITSFKGGLLQLELTNTGKEQHDLQLVRIDGTHTVAEFDKATNTDGGPIPSWIHGAGGVSLVNPGQMGRATVNLPKGSYLFVCSISNDTNGKSHALNGMGGTLTVSGSDSAALPKTSASVVAKDYGFTVSGLKAGKNTVTFRNSGKELHHVLMAQLSPGKSANDLKTFLASQNPSGPPPIDFEKMQVTTVNDPGFSSVIEATLPAGRYAFFCFINDRAGGPPHFTKGMLQEVVVK